MLGESGGPKYTATFADDLGLTIEDGTGLETPPTMAVGLRFGNGPRLFVCPLVGANADETAGMMLVRKQGRPPPDRVGSP
jgi:hypothetical protein